MSIYELLKTEPYKHLTPILVKKLYGNRGVTARAKFSSKLHGYKGQKFTPDEEKKIQKILKKSEQLFAYVEQML